MLIRLRVLAVCSAFICGTLHATTDSHWDYPSGGSIGIDEITAGKAGLFRAFRMTTTDSPEKVLLWYAARLGLPKDHSLAEAAEKGFSTLRRTLVISSGYGHDTEQRSDHTVIVASLAPKESHITFLHRPELEGGKDVMISLTSVTNGTSISVIRPIQGEFRKQD